MTHRADSPSKQEQLCGGKDEPEGTALPTQMLTCIGLRPREEMVMRPETKTGLVHTARVEKIGPKHHTNSPKLVYSYEEDHGRA